MHLCFILMFLSLSNFYYEQIVMDSSNLEETYDDESDVEDGEADDELNDEFEGVLKQVQNDSCHQQTSISTITVQLGPAIYNFELSWLFF